MASSDYPVKEKTGLVTALDTKSKSSPSGELCRLSMRAENYHRVVRFLLRDGLLRTPFDGDPNLTVFPRVDRFRAAPFFTGIFLKPMARTFVRTASTVRFSLRAICGVVIDLYDERSVAISAALHSLAFFFCTGFFAAPRLAGLFLAAGLRVFVVRITQNSLYDCRRFSDTRHIVDDPDHRVALFNRNKQHVQTSTT